MKHNARFLEAVYAYASGGSERELAQAMALHVPKPADITWVINAYRIAAGIEPLDEFKGDFIRELDAHMDYAATIPRRHVPILTVHDAEQRADIASHKKLCDKLDIHGSNEPIKRSKGAMLHEALLADGWQTLSGIVKDISHNNGLSRKKFNEMLERSEANGFANDICRFTGETITYTSLSPALAERCLKHAQVDVLLSIQPGERVKSRFHSGINNLLEAITTELIVRHVRPEIALVERRARTDNAFCLTSLLQEVLLERGIVKFKSDNVNQDAITILSAIPKDPHAFADFVGEICKSLQARSAAVKNPAERFIGKFSDGNRPR